MNVILEYLEHILTHFWRGSAAAFSKLGALAPPSAATNLDFVIVDTIIVDGLGVFQFTIWDIIFPRIC